MTPAGLPVGLQIMTSHFAEAAMFRLADAYQKSCGAGLQPAAGL
jgi:Asp-tRNA(Asn)/Glu-tRNA(Gln) amidotransferase A subunit family amidase